MPYWLKNQLMKAFQRGDIRKIRLLNDCWFFYRSQAIHMKPDSNNNQSMELH
ncbi:cortex morphogenetic protein CmpA [Paenibacillus septentrionalis]|uniref:Cortex morphogenetic protein CmpA n=1 Tax=Paenibacillus septentrionalis TaxID=429342 RepID=A0ABW1VAZ9_9BACL